MGEWLRWWANEILQMSGVGRIALFIQLPTIEAKNIQTHRTFKRMGTAGEAARRSSQTSQIMAQLGITCFNRIGVGFSLRYFIPSIVIPETIISLKSIAIIAFRFGRFVHYILNSLLSAYPDHFPAQKAARLPIYKREEVDPVFLWPINVNNSSASASLTCSG